LAKKEERAGERTARRRVRLIAAGCVPYQGRPASSSATAYSTILVTTPEPTVRPPSRMANRNRSSMAMGVISSTSSSALSPGMIISTPSFSRMMPVTSVVRK